MDKISNPPETIDIIDRADQKKIEEIRKQYPNRYFEIDVVNGKFKIVLIHSNFTSYRSCDDGSQISYYTCFVCGMPAKGRNGKHLLETRTKGSYAYFCRCCGIEWVKYGPNEWS